MTFQQELASWSTPTAPIEPIHPAPQIGETAPSSSLLPFPNSDGKPTIVTFLRHCGCPFAEKTFKSLTKLSIAHPEIRFIAVSHSSQQATDDWVIAAGGEWDVTVLVDEKRELYALWGLGMSNYWHVLNPWSLCSVYNLGKTEGIWNRPTESGTRWQTAGSWAVDGKAIVRWGGAAKTADEVPDFGEAMKALGVDPGKRIALL